MLTLPSAHLLWSNLKPLQIHSLLQSPGRHQSLPSPQGVHNLPGEARYSSRREGLKKKEKEWRAEKPSEGDRNGRDADRRFEEAKIKH